MMSELANRHMKDAARSSWFHTCELYGTLTTSLNPVLLSLKTYAIALHRESQTYLTILLTGRNWEYHLTDLTLKAVAQLYVLHRLFRDRADMKHSIDRSEDDSIGTWMRLQ